MAILLDRTKAILSTTGLKNTVGSNSGIPVIFGPKYYQYSLQYEYSTSFDASTDPTRSFDGNITIEHLRGTPFTSSITTGNLNVGGYSYIPNSSVLEYNIRYNINTSSLSGSGETPSYKRIDIVENHRYEEGGGPVGNQLNCFLGLGANTTSSANNLAIALDGVLFIRQFTQTPSTWKCDIISGSISVGSTDSGIESTSSATRTFTIIQGPAHTHSFYIDNNLVAVKSASINYPAFTNNIIFSRGFSLSGNLSTISMSINENIKSFYISSSVGQIM